MLRVDYYLAPLLAVISSAAISYAQTSEKTSSVLALPSASVSTSSASSITTSATAGLFDVAALATSLDLSTHWAAPVPSSLNGSYGDPSLSSSSSPTNTLDWLSRSWSLWNNRLYGGDAANLEFMDDPFAGLMEVPEKVLKVEYEKGSFKQSGGDTGNGGATFYASPTQLGLARKALLNYQVAFDPSFDYVKGGKLPGFWSGKSASDCSGGKQSEDGSCFSVRMMWRSEGLGEVYAYLPQSNNICDNATATDDSSTPIVTTGAVNSLICNEDYGTSIGRGTFSFAKGSFTNVTMFIQLNTPTLKDGVLKVWANGSPVVDMDNLILRNAAAPLRIFFSTFFGGSNAAWASTSDTRSYFKNLHVYMDTPVSDSSSSALPTRSFSMSGILLLLLCVLLAV